MGTKESGAQATGWEGDENEATRKQRLVAANRALALPVEQVSPLPLVPLRSSSMCLCQQQSCLQWLWKEKLMVGTIQRQWKSLTKVTCFSCAGAPAEEQEPVDSRQVHLGVGPSPDLVCALDFDWWLVLRCVTPRIREDPGDHLHEVHPRRLWEWRWCDAPTGRGFEGSFRCPPPAGPTLPACFPSWSASRPPHPLLFSPALPCLILVSLQVSCSLLQALQIPCGTRLSRRKWRKRQQPPLKVASRHPLVSQPDDWQAPPPRGWSAAAPPPPPLLSPRRGLRPALCAAPGCSQCWQGCPVSSSCSPPLPPPPCPPLLHSLPPH